MTLLVNEIRVGEDLRQSLIVQAADRRYTVGGKFHSNRKKLFKIPHLNAGVGYFGLAQPNTSTFFSSWLSNFVRRACDTQTLEAFARLLCDELNRHVSKSLLAAQGSGFHVCGYSAEALPELWFVTNIGGMDGPYYKDFRTRYYISEEFLAKHARAMGYDGTGPSISNSFNQYYINGDVRPFHSIWQRLDEFSFEMFSYPDFQGPQKPDDLEDIVKWKMRVIASFYREFAQTKAIGGPIDAFVLSPRGSA